MLKNVYSIRDCKTNFSYPMVHDNDEEAKRSFAMAIHESKGCVIWFAPSDFDLYFIGTFDTDNGNLCSFTCRLIAHGSDYGNSPNA